MEYLIEYSEQIEKSYMEIRKFKHDYKNILVSMENYIQSNDIDGFETFFFPTSRKLESFLIRNY